VAGATESAVGVARLFHFVTTVAGRDVAAPVTVDGNFLPKFNKSTVCACFAGWHGA
jgi:hypothetical protein